MKRPTIIVLTVIILLVTGAVIFSNMQKNDTSHTSQDSPSNKESSKQDEPAKPNEVLIKDFAYGPEKLTVKKGTTVTWTNRDSAKHDITPTSGAEDFKASELLAKDETYSFTFNTVGTYTYKCSPHPYMKGTVVVTE